MGGPEAPGIEIYIAQWDVGTVTGSTTTYGSDVSNAVVPITMTVNSSYQITLPTFITLSLNQTNHAEGSYKAICNGVIGNNEKVFLTPSSISLTDESGTEVDMQYAQTRQDWRNTSSDGFSYGTSAQIAYYNVYTDEDNEIIGSISSPGDIRVAGTYTGELRFAFGKTAITPDP